MVNLSRDMTPMPSPVRKFALKAIVVLSLVLVGEVIFLTLLAPQIKISRAVVEGAPGLTKAQVLDLAGVKLGEYFFAVEPGILEEKLVASGFVSQAEVKKIFPDTLHFKLSLRQPVALAVAQGAQGAQLVALDREGVLCALVDSAEQSNLPVLSGVEFQKVKLGLRLPEVLTPLMADLGALKSASQALYQWISEIKVTKSRNHSFQLTVYPSRSPLRILMADRLDPRLLKEAAVVADILTKQGMESEVRELDFRTDQIVLKASEG